MTEMFVKAGGRYNLASLAQKRASALIKGAAPLVERKGMTTLHVVLTELDEGKLTLELATQKKDRTQA